MLMIYVTSKICDLQLSFFALLCSKRFMITGTHILVILFISTISVACYYIYRAVSGVKCCRTAAGRFLPLDKTFPHCCRTLSTIGKNLPAHCRTLFTIGQKLPALLQGVFYHWSEPCRRRAATFSKSWIMLNSPLAIKKGKPARFPLKNI